MFTIMYTTGNGYRCSCCRRSDSSYEDFDTEAEAIERCIELSRSAEGDFTVDAIRGYDGDADELEMKIEKAIDADEAAQKKLKKLEELKSSIKTLERWQENLPQEIEMKAKNLADLKRQLNEEEQA